MKLKELLNIKELENLIKDGYILSNEHPNDKNLKILSYTQKTQFEGLWNNITKQCRGLIVRTYNNDFKNADVVERPWSKFFTLEQHESGWALGDEGESNKTIDLNIDFNAKAEVTDKIDGSLGILYTLNDDIFLATRGSFESEQSIYYNKFLRTNKEYYDRLKLLKETYPNITFLFELVGLNNRIVIKYEKDDIIFLGAVNVNTGRYYSTDDFKDIWTLNIAEKMNAKNLTEALALPPRKEKEGVVVRILADSPKDQMQIKIKQEDYLILHRLAYSFSKKSSKDLIRDLKFTYGEYIKFYLNNTVENNRRLNIKLEPFSKKQEEFYENIYYNFINLLNFNLLDISKSVYESYIYIMNLNENLFKGDERDVIKNFVMNLENNNEKAMLIDMFKCRLYNEDIVSKEAHSINRFVLDNFKDIEEV